MRVAEKLDLKGLKIKKSVGNLKIVGKDRKGLKVTVKTFLILTQQIRSKN
jgi:hypothetical protein